MSNGNLSKKKGLLSEINQENLDYISDKVKIDVDAELGNKVDKEEYEGFKGVVEHSLTRQDNNIYELQRLQKLLSMSKLDVSAFDNYKTEFTTATKKLFAEHEEENIAAFATKADKEELLSKADLVDGKVPASQLPGYVDDIIEGKLLDDETFSPYLTDSNESNPNAIYVQQSGKLYVDLETGITYRWSGRKYVEVSSSLALGETSSTAYPGNKGKQNAEDIQHLFATKVSKENGKQLSTEDYTTAEKEKLEGLENYDDAPVKENTNKIDLLNKYGTTDVYVLQEGVDFVTDETGTIIIGTVSGYVLDFSGKTIAIPEGIVSFEPTPDSNGTFYREDGARTSILITADKIIFPSSFHQYSTKYLRTTKIGLSEGMLMFSSPSCSFIGNPPIYLPSSLQSLSLSLLGSCSVYASSIFSEAVNDPGRTFSIEVKTAIESHLYLPYQIVEVNFDFGDTSHDNHCYIYNPNATINGCFYGTVHGFAGSTAEAFAKENGYTFVNIGSDYSIPINASTATVATIRPNEYYTFSGVFDEIGNEVAPLSSLTVTLDTASTTKLDEFMFSFETPSDISTFSFGVLTDESIEIKWVKEPNLKPDYVYEVSVVSGVGVIAGTAKEVTE